MLGYMTAFFGGFFLEALAVFWVHYSERNQRLKLTCISALQAIALVAGVGESVDNWQHGCVFIIGYALGANAAIYLKKYFNE